MLGLTLSGWLAQHRAGAQGAASLHLCAGLSYRLSACAHHAKCCRGVVAAMRLWQSHFSGTYWYLGSLSSLLLPFSLSVLLCDKPFVIRYLDTGMDMLYVCINTVVTVNG